MHQFKLTEMKTNLLYAPESYALAHAVSADLNTMKGTLAWQFAVIFGNFEELSKQPIMVGNVAVMEHQSRFIYFLVTKENVYETTTYNTLHAALICMREHMRIHEITKIAMPRICCGTDGLEWQRVKQLIRTVFARETNVEILVCSYNQAVTIPPKCQIVEVKGNIFSAPQDYSLVHSTSADFAMSSGIGLHFKCKFGQISELQKQNKHVGNVAVLKDNNRYIYNLITKERSHEKCTYPALYYALMAMREHVEQNNVTKLAIHRFGGDIDRLSWLRVKNIVEFVFCNIAVEIIAYVYDPPEVVRRRSRDSRSRSRTLESMVNPQTTTTVQNPFHTATAQQLRQNMSADTKYKLTEVEGDLFNAPETHSLAHCVGADFVMGAGIAVKFKQIYGQVDNLLAQGVQSGGVAVLQDKQRYIYYLVTKPQSWGSPTYDSLRASLTAMREHMRKNNVHKLAIPRIGCGIDGLEWDKVSAELNTVFVGEELEIVVYNFVPK